MTLGPWSCFVALVAIVGWVIYRSSRTPPRPIIWPTEYGRVMRWERARGEYLASRRFTDGEMEIHAAEIRALEIQRQVRVAQVFDARASIVPRLDPARFPDAPLRAEQGAPACLSPSPNAGTTTADRQANCSPTAFADAVPLRSPRRRDDAVAAARYPSFFRSFSR